MSDRPCLALRVWSCPFVFFATPCLALRLASRCVSGAACLAACVSPCVSRRASCSLRLPHLSLLCLPRAPTHTQTHARTHARTHTHTLARSDAPGRHAARVAGVTVSDVLQFGEVGAATRGGSREREGRQRSRARSRPAPIPFAREGEGEGKVEDTHRHIGTGRRHTWTYRDR